MNIIKNLKQIFYVYSFPEKERQSMSRKGSEREGNTETKTGCRLWAVSTEPNAGLKLTNQEIMTWAEVWHSTDWATQMPLSKKKKKKNLMK